MEELCSKPAFHYHIVLFEPEIPPNTGNAGRLAVAVQGTLHLVGKLGFDISDKQVRRAGLDYWKFVDLKLHASFSDWLSWYRQNSQTQEFYFIETTGPQTQSLYQTKFSQEVAFIFGKETTGIPQEIISQFAEKVLTIPMFSSRIRSLNLSNSIAITLYEAIRQQLG